MKDLDSFPDFITALPRVALPFEGATAWLIQGQNQQVVFLAVDETIDVPDHQHGEQWEHVLAGRVELRRDGTTHEYTAGDHFFLPAGVPHGAKVHAGYRAAIYFNEPDRYKPA